MARFKWRKWNRALHRDLGYLFFGMTIIYGLSGIALNHIQDWNPNFSITSESVAVTIPQNPKEINKQVVLKMLENIGEEDNYKKYYFPSQNQLKVFLNGGSILVDLNNQMGFLEKIKRRPVFHQVNFLHYNPQKWWTYYSDLYSVALIFLAITGLFILKGRTGITGRGAWLTAVGIIVPLIFLMLYY